MNTLQGQAVTPKWEETRWECSCPHPSNDRRPQPVMPSAQPARCKPIGFQTSPAMTVLRLVPETKAPSGNPRLPRACPMPRPPRGTPTFQMVVSCTVAAPCRKFHAETPISTGAVHTKRGQRRVILRSGWNFGISLNPRRLSTDDVPRRPLTTLSSKKGAQQLDSRIEFRPVAPIA